MWWHIVMVAVINAWNLYRRDQKKLQPRQKPMALWRFQAAVSTSLTSAWKGKIKCGRPLSSPEAGGTPPHKRPTSSVKPDVRKHDWPFLNVGNPTEMQALHKQLLREMSSPSLSEQGQKLFSCLPQCKIKRLWNKQWTKKWTKPTERFLFHPVSPVVG